MGAWRPQRRGFGIVLDSRGRWTPPHTGGHRPSSAERFHRRCGRPRQPHWARIAAVSGSAYCPLLSRPYRIFFFACGFPRRLSLLHPCFPVFHVVHIPHPSPPPSNHTLPLLTIHVVHGGSFSPDPRRSHLSISVTHAAGFAGVTSDFHSLSASLSSSPPSGSGSSWSPSSPAFSSGSSSSGTCPGSGSAGPGVSSLSPFSPSLPLSGSSTGWSSGAGAGSLSRHAVAMADRGWLPPPLTWCVADGGESPSPLLPGSVSPLAGRGGPVGVLSEGVGGIAASALVVVGDDSGRVCMTLPRQRWLPGRAGADAPTRHQALWFKRRPLMPEWCPGAGREQALYGCVALCK
ncbi:hypothetical protein I4F81_001912 [Pyropia yezoensis]|uniref:Uncharacterized protein n=1 Tax=Pyropia yezoensis TaxID=2788 RepID=A0ACC3BN33_PYRYE|nr:hypothetical protein I4F81_001912 [Neopyropia yezoensis]